MTVAVKETYQNFLDKVQEKFSGEDYNLILKAYNFSITAHKDQKRISGEPYFCHCIATAENLIEHVPDTYTICAALLHDVLEDTKITLEDLKKEFSEPIPELVEGVTKISELKFQSEREQQIESFRKMFLAMAKDIRVIIIKMADRLHNMRTIKYLAEDKRIAFAKETLEIYAPLAYRLGMSRIKAEFEDRSMEVLFPEEYKSIVSEIEKKREHWENIITIMKYDLYNLLNQYDIKAEINGRTKHVYSIYRKKIKQGIDLGEIYDLVAMRIITETEVDCYEALGIVHSNWVPIPHRIKDFIAMPKENMYRSLHTTIILPTKDRVEIQIRTKEMHKIAEEGVAAHWKYKEGKAGVQSDIEEKLNWLKTFREWILSETYTSTDFLDTLKQDIFTDSVFCFTPKGDVVELPKGSTPVDFAFAIHSAVGERCVGSKVNDKIVPLRYELNNGDIVEIITAKNAHPSSNWLEFVKTSRARNKIRHHIRSLNFDKNVEQGKEILFHALKGKNISLTQIQTYMRSHLSNLRVNSFEELLAGLGFGNINIQQVVSRVLQEMQKQEKEKKEPSGENIAETKFAEQQKAQIEKDRENVFKGQKAEILVDGMPNALTRLALCCKPEKGEPIIGFVTRGRGVSIHKVNCLSLNNLIEKNKVEDSRLIKVEWHIGAKKKNKKITIRVVSLDRIGLLSEVTAIITSHKLTIVGSDTKVNNKNSLATLRFNILTENPSKVKNILNEIKFNVKGIIRTEIVRRGKKNKEEEK